MSPNAPSLTQTINTDCEDLMGFLTGILNALGLGGSGSSDKYKSVASQIKVVEQDSGKGVEKTMHFTFSPPKSQYIVKVDGVYSVFGCKDEMPPEVRQDVESLEHSSDAKSNYVIIMEGRKRTYHSVEEMPEEMRKAVLFAEKEVEKP